MSFRSKAAIRPFALVTEAVRIALSAPVASSVTGLIVAAVTGVILLTTGQTVQAEQDVLRRIDDAGTRLVVAIDDQGSANITPAAVTRIAALSNAEWIIGLGYADDARNANIGWDANPSPIRTLWGTPPPPIMVNGRTPAFGEGIVGQDAAVTLGLEYPIGGVQTNQAHISIVGGFIASDPLTHLNRSILTPPDPAGEELLRSVHVLATDPNQVEQLTVAVAQVLGAEDPTAVRFETSRSIAQVRIAVAGELGQYSRRLVLGALSVGLTLISLSIYGSVTLRRQDFGRRRALGATRSTIIALVTTHYLMVSIVGVGTGVGIATVLVERWTDTVPNLPFALAISTLTILTTLAATIPPAIVAALRDPIRVLRIP